MELIQLLKHFSGHLPLLVCKLSLIIFLLSKPIKADDVTLEMAEQQAVGTIIGDILTASRLSEKYSPDVVSKLQFSMLPESENSGHSSYFNIDSQTGKLSIRKVIDREELCVFRVDCVLEVNIAASTQQQPTVFESIIAKINVIDINDNPPQFPYTSYSLIIPENTEVGSTFPLPEAIDKDSVENGIKSYNILPDQPEFGLKTVANLDGSMGIQLIILQGVDRELRDSYKMDLVASDNGNPSLTGRVELNITIGDTNDNVATFEQAEYIADVMEDLQVPNFIIQVKAIDNDLGDAGKVVYSFSAKTLSLNGDMFEINPNTGEIRVIKAFDYEKVEQYSLTVVAKDSAPNARISQATVTIFVHDVNDFAPQITINTLTSNGQAEVAENALLQTFVAHISVVDRDSRLNGQVQCHLDSVKYSLQKIKETQFKLVTASVFDREVESFNEVNITCTDLGTPSLSSSKSLQVSILDQNDNPPEFEQAQYSVVIQENNPEDIYITTVKATDSDYGVNARVNYSLLNGGNDFVIDPNTGIIRAKKAMNYEENHEITLTAMAQDGGSPTRSSRTSVIIKLLDVNDNPPQFIQTNGQFNFIVVENKPVGTHIGQVKATDPDSPPNDRVIYQLADTYSPARAVISIDATTGELKSKIVFDREVKAFYNFNVIAYNPDTPEMKAYTMVNVYIEDTNDHNPEFVFPSKSNHTLQIVPNIQAGEVITQVAATDLDEGNNAWLTYSFISGNEDGYFIIGSTNGLITVTRDLAQSPQDTFNLSIGVSDNGAPPRTNNEWLYITLNATLPITEEYPANMIILICLVSITGILMILLLMAILFLVYKARYRAREQQKYGNEEGCGEKTNTVEIINRLDTSHLQVDLNSSFKSPIFDFSKHTGGKPNINSHTSADSGFDEVTISPHGKLVSFRAAPSHLGDRKMDIKDEDQRSASSEEGSNTDSGCVVSEPGADDSQLTNQQPAYIIFKNKNKMASSLSPAHKQSLNSYSHSHNSPKDIKNNDKYIKINPRCPDICQTNSIDNVKVDGKLLTPPPFPTFYDSNSLMKYKMNTKAQRCASEMTDNTSTTSGSYVITGEEFVNC